VNLAQLAQELLHLGMQRQRASSLQPQYRLEDAMFIHSVVFFPPRLTLSPASIRAQLSMPEIRPAARG
jgi:hypothetical protein